MGATPTIPETIEPLDTPAGAEPVLAVEKNQFPEYDEWQANPTPENLNRVVTKLAPTIDYAVRQVGRGDDPYLRGQARVIAARAVKSYSPTADASLPTWTSQQLMRLRRIQRQSNVSARIPERMQLDALALSQAEAEIEDRHDREPDIEELADATGLSRRRIEEIRRTMRQTPSEEALGELTIDPRTVDLTDEAIDIVYQDLDYTDRKLLEMRTGYGGKYEPMMPDQISKQLNLSPTQISRRGARIALKIREIEQALEENG